MTAKRPYLDLGFLACLTLPTDGTDAAWKVATLFDGPWPLNPWQRFILELNLRRDQPAERLRYFQNQLVGNWMELSSPAWEDAFEQAATWGRSHPDYPSNILLDPAFASAQGATHFLSFDSRSRKLAKMAGLEVRPVDI